uniref:GrpE protein homolog n=1 Tax=Grammatophora oceanica TaxID=210454 RepID=A0A7S1Y6Z3_9STRA|mmetsp:Transcript_27350/g.40052  ORF Transcript_27350/g.40052 Transcript_27350/m.40052 type:complete len:305 (+) Transcript_27350:103-1017(+)|eukprot:CAMPEP_0194029846 /NCGR_PEP_ID=MMETSP0009_2-20130614/3482_1 /TAXON_ID=210454 /ORGANISM="Grammatophora oceanica, Strain CCMP 410" /LENGTH=304 /DNA_ID=CAMNT_0038669637 /DNA_START=33 /DNA_END=947 /DNA_ORIENTATION=+
MSRPNTIAVLLCLVLLATTVVNTVRGFAFVPKNVQPRCVVAMPSSSSAAVVVAPSTTRLYAAEEETKASEEATEEATDEEEEEDEKESEEMVALKKEIDELEGQLASKQAAVTAMKEDVFKYSKEGYVRRVAELETAKRMTKSFQSSSKEANMAVVLKDFLPVLDDLTALQKRDASSEGDSFGSKYEAVSILEEWKKMGVKEIVLEAGSSEVDGVMAEATSEEYSDTVPKGCVITPVSTGLELKGHVIRPATAIVSMGSEEEAKKAAAAEAEKKAKAAEAEKKKKKKKRTEDDAADEEEESTKE